LEDHYRKYGRVLSQETYVLQGSRLIGKISYVVGGNRLICLPLENWGLGSEAQLDLPYIPNDACEAAGTGK